MEELTIQVSPIEGLNLSQLVGIVPPCVKKLTISYFDKEPQASHCLLTNECPPLPHILEHLTIKASLLKDIFSIIKIFKTHKSITVHLEDFNKRDVQDMLSLTHARRFIMACDSDHISMIKQMRKDKRFRNVRQIVSRFKGGIERFN